MKFVGGPWEPDSRAGTFGRFLEAHASLKPDEFRARVVWPHLVIGTDTDPTTWDKGICVRLAPRSGKDLDVTVGRGPESDVVLYCPTISGKHVRFTGADGRWFVEDLKSKTDTWLDGKRLDHGAKFELAGERPVIQIGPDVTATFLTPAAMRAFLDEAIARRRAGPAAPPPMPLTTKKSEWPTWSLLQEPRARTNTERLLPVLKIEAIGTAPDKKVGDAAPRPPRPRGLDSLTATRERIVTTLACLAVTALVVLYTWRSIGIMLFGSTHPEWFR